MTHSVAPDRDVKTAPQRRIYDRAPILETIIEIRVSSLGAVDLPTLHALRNGDENRYSKELALIEGSLSVEVTGSGASVASSTAQQLGYEWQNAAGAEIFRASSKHLSYHKLKPYTKWEYCRDEARRLWDKYLRIVKPQSIERLGLRYVNRLDLPPSGELTDYLLTVPEIAPGLHQELSGYMMSLTIPQPDIPNTRVRLRQATVEPPSPQVASVVFDIDVIRTLNVPADSNQLWTAFEQVHERQNQIFELCITDRTRGLIS